MENFRPTLLRNKALDALRGKWNQAAVVGLIILFFAIVCGGLGLLSSFLNLALMIFVASFVSVGGYFVFQDLIRKGTIENDTLFEAFRDYGRYLLGIVLVYVYTLLWTLLLIVPGIIKSISYSMTYYIMRENPGMSGEQAIQRSMAMMQGHKMDFFLLGLSFIGWALLAVLTCGIGMIWLAPYMYTAYAAFYEELKKDYEAKNGAAVVA